MNQLNFWRAFWAQRVNRAESRSAAGQPPAPVSAAEEVLFLLPFPFQAARERAAGQRATSVRGREAAAPGDGWPSAASEKTKDATPYIVASGHTVTNTPDLFRTPQLSVTGPG